MNDYEKQQEHYDKAMKNLIEAGKDYQKLTPQHKAKFAEEVFEMYGMFGIIYMIKNQR